jgi:hypothetical protein
MKTVTKFKRELGVKKIKNCPIHVFEDNHIRRGWNAEEEEIIGEYLNENPIRPVRGKKGKGQLIQLSQRLERTTNSIVAKITRMRKELL